MTSHGRGRFVLIAGLLIWIYVPTVGWMVDRWWVADSYYAHGPLIPLICGFLLFRRRKELASLAFRPSPWGWRWIAIGLTLQLASALVRIYFLSALSFFVVLLGLILAVGGIPLFRKVWFPYVFGFFMVPLPLVSVAALSLRMKLQAAYVSARLLGGMGIPVMQDGSILYLPHSTVLVEDLCSGLRSLIALVALGVLVAYTLEAARWKRGLLFLSAVPIAIGANVFRIVVVCLVSELYGAHSASGPFHDTMGFVSFFVAYGMLASFGTWLK